MAEFDLAAARRDLVAAVGADLLLAERPNDFLLDDALRTALDGVIRRAPLEETTVTVAEASRTVDLGALLPDIFEVGGVYPPWMDSTGEGRIQSAAFRVLSPGVVLLEGPTMPQVGTVLRVRYRRAYTVRDLDGATVTTLPATFERALVMGAAGALMDTQVLRMGLMAPPASEAEMDGIRRVARVYWSRSFEMMAERAGHVVLNWSRAGLD